MTIVTRCLTSKRKENAIKWKPSFKRKWTFLSKVDLSETISWQFFCKINVNLREFDVNVVNKKVAKMIKITAYKKRKKCNDIKNNNFQFKWLQLDSNSEPLSSQTNTITWKPSFTRKWTFLSKLDLSEYSLSWVFVYELSGSGFESICSHINFRFHSYFE